MPLSLFGGKRGRTNGTNTESSYHPKPSAPVLDDLPIAVPVVVNNNNNDTIHHSYAPMNDDHNHQQSFLPSYRNTSTAPTPTTSTSANVYYSNNSNHNSKNYNNNHNKHPHNQPIITNEEIQTNIHSWKHQMFGGRPLLHKLFILLSVGTSLTAINCVVAHLVCGIILYGHLDHGMELVLRFYTVGLCVLVIVIEMDKSEFIRQNVIFTHWTTRGLFYVFLGVLGVVEHDIGRINYNNNSYMNSYSTIGKVGPYFVIRIPTGEGVGEFYIWLTSSMMIVFGIVYMILGTCCLHRTMEHYRQLYNQQRTSAT